MSDSEIHRTTGPGAVSRRDFVKLGAAGTAGAVGLGGAGSRAPSAVGDGEAALCGGICVGVAVAAGAAGIGLIAGHVASHYVGEDRSDELDGTEETADLHRELRTRLMELYASNDRILTTANNRIEDARNVAWPAAKKEAVKARNNEETEQAAIDAAVAEIDSHYVTIQKNLLNRGTEWVNSLMNIFSLHESDSTLSEDPVIAVDGSHFYDGSENTYTVNPGDFSSIEQETSLVDGNAFTHKAAEATLSTGSTADESLVVLSPAGIHVEATGAWDPGSVSNPIVDPVESGSTASWLNLGVWSDIWSSVESEHSAMVSNINTYVTMLYQNTTAGEIDPSNWLSAETIASELATDYETTGYHAYAAAEAAIAGIPGNFSQSMEITWEDDGITVAGSIWTEWAPASQTSTETETETSAETTETETATDDGTQAAGTEAFNVGETYDPDNTNKIVLVSYEYAGEDWIPGSDVWVKDDSDAWVEDESVTTAEGWTALEGDKMQVGYGELEQSFTIESAKDPESGESVDTVSTESKNHQTSDVGVTEEQMDAFLALAEEMRENESPGSGGAGGFLPESGSTGMLLLVLAGGAAALGLSGNS